MTARWPGAEDRGWLVVVAGLPGVGKTTLVRRLAGAEGVRALDSEQVAHQLRALPAPYRVLRPVVHAVHLARVVSALRSASPCVLTSDPMTSPWRRALLWSAAAWSGRRLRIVLVDGSPAEARDGQRRRGRKLSERRMSRHEQRFTGLRGALGSDDVVLSRPDAAVAPALQVLGRAAGERLSAGVPSQPTPGSRVPAQAAGMLSHRAVRRHARS